MSDAIEAERKRAIAAIHWVFNADGTVGERAMAQEAIHKINDPTFMPALSAYEAAKGVAWYALHSKTGAHVGLWTDKSTPERLLADYPGGTITTLYSALTSPASGSGTREEIKGAVGRETEGWPAETDHVPSPASGERDAPQCCMCGKNGLSTTEGDGGAECELADGRWVCSQACYDKAVPMPGGERDAVIDYTKAAERLLRARPFGDATIGKYLGLEDNYHSTAVMARALAAALRMEGSAVTASDESDE